MKFNNSFHPVSDFLQQNGEMKEGTVYRSSTENEHLLRVSHSTFNTNAKQVKDALQIESILHYTYVHSITNDMN